MSEPALPIEIRADNIAVLSLIPNPKKPRGGVVVLDRWLIDSLDAALCQLAKQDLSGLILQSSSARVFVAGADLAEIDALNDADLDVYLRAGSVAYGRISALAFTSVAVIHKAALGGGLELAMHCDALIGAVPAPGEKSWKVGLPECGLGICPGWGGTMMLAARMDISKAIMATCTGTPFDSTEIPSGLFVKKISAGESATEIAVAWIHANPKIQTRRSPLSVADAQFHQATLKVLEQLESQLPNTAAARAALDAVRAGLQHGFQAGLLCEQKHLIELRHTPEARACLDAFLKR
ncbi:MAG: enoyl-CoA hydratase/isomerase family protein [Phycisphaerales bacterium]|nr:enoyl-CoA hydratase/isomerase family protein [Phycisphaerales bacterium]